MKEFTGINGKGDFVLKVNDKEVQRKSFSEKDK